jgi:TonB family protein
MALPQKPVRQSSRLTTAVVISLLAHALLLPYLAKDAMFRVQHKQGVSIISGKQFRDLVQNQARLASGAITSSGQQVPQAPKDEKKEPPKPEEQAKIDGQIVSLGTPEDQRPPDKPTKYISEHDSRVEKETRARNTAFYKNALSKMQKEGRKDSAAAGAPAFSEHPGEEGKGGGEQERRKKQVAELPSKSQRDALHVPEAADGTLRNREAGDAVVGNGQKLAMANPGREGKQSSPGSGNPSASPGMPGQQKPLKLTLDQPIGASGPIEGGPMPDKLDGVEEGEGTFLNAKGFKYASYLNRLKETVGRIWAMHLDDETRKRDPTGEMFGAGQDKVTVVLFTVDRDGEFINIKLQASSGVTYLDNVALDAFKLAERIPNPPPGLLAQDGTLTMPFTFIYGIVGGSGHWRVAPSYVPGSAAARGF